MTEDKTTIVNQSEEPNDRLLELVGRAITDDRFRDLLFSDRTQAVREYNLTERDLAALDNLDKQQLEKIGEGVAGASSITIFIGIYIEF